MGKAFKPELDDRGFMVHLADLKKDYQNTLKVWQEKRDALRAELQSKTKIVLEDLAKKEHKAERNRLKSEFPALIERINEISEITADLNFTINFLHTGRLPGSKRGIDRRSIYQRTVLVDPTIMGRYIQPTNSRSASTLTEDEQHKLKEVLDILSPREREVFILAKGQGFPHEYIANMLNMQKGSVDVMVKRAHKKMSAGWQGTLF
ncbi:sigma factor-like helix-turn-helix DNA-binding protein [Paenibacillus sp. L3-i20]|uniref:sigma factor-like helix-turn-helix DNA-binding protein n=1 Tax=Paenibacillus sp. L3-i20 TaxID=2905833 RepID=UPI001EDF3426|nr:sigma factor-like helix-turn-helix DNA-binding protein [Paenibacillus sp. L3-i20]GKU79797.1 hypothetical protein L3i20_v241940 [Paenibacillus sp. L3-i20]